MPVLGRHQGRLPEEVAEPEGKETPAQHHPGTAPGLGWEAESLGSWESPEQVAGAQVQALCHLGAGHRHPCLRRRQNLLYPSDENVKAPARGGLSGGERCVEGPAGLLSVMG